MTTQRHAGVLDRVGRRADRPAVAAGLVAAAALAFSTAWFALVGGDAPVVPVLLVATVANAAAVTSVVWRLVVPSGAWSYRRGAGAGLLVGLGSHLTVGIAWVLALLATGNATDFSASAAEAFAAGLTLSAFSVPTTFGVPTLLSVGIALGLTHARRRTGGASGPRADPDR